MHSLSFSSDTQSMEVSLLASVSRGADGANVILWDMNKKKIYSRLPTAHEGK